MSIYWLRKPQTPLQMSSVDKGRPQTISLQQLRREINARLVNMNKLLMYRTFLEIQPTTDCSPTGSGCDRRKLQMCGTCVFLIIVYLREWISLI